MARVPSRLPRRPSSAPLPIANRSLVGIPPIRRDLIKRHLYLVPNSIVVSRGCPHVCDFCYKEAFFQGGKSFYTQTVDDALAEIARLPRPPSILSGRSSVWRAPLCRGAFRRNARHGTRLAGRRYGEHNSSPGLLEKAVACGLRSLFVGFETTDEISLREQRKFQNLRRDYGEAVRRLHDLGVMVNGSFVFGMERTRHKSSTAPSIGPSTRHRNRHLPYPDALSRHRSAHANAGGGSNLHRHWDLYDTRHCVFRPAEMTGDSGSRILAGLQKFLCWGSI